METTMGMPSRSRCFDLRLLTWINQNSLKTWDDQVGFNTNTKGGNQLHSPPLAIRTPAIRTHTLKSGFCEHTAKAPYVQLLRYMSKKQVPRGPWGPCPDNNAPDPGENYRVLIARGGVYASTKRALIQTRRGEIDDGEHDRHGFAKSMFWNSKAWALKVSNIQRLSFLINEFNFFTWQVWK